MVAVVNVSSAACDSEEKRAADSIEGNGKLPRVVAQGKRPLNTSFFATSKVKTNDYFRTHVDFFIQKSLCFHCSRHVYRSLENKSNVNDNNSIYIPVKLSTTLQYL